MRGGRATTIGIGTKLATMKRSPRSELDGGP
jgi:hypothetical protein